MNAKLAREIVERKMTEKHTELERRIQENLDILMGKVLGAAANGCSHMKFSLPHVHNLSEIDEVRNRLKKLGYGFTNETDNGFEYELTHW